MPKSFTELKVWQEGFSLVLQVYQVTQEFPQSEQFGLVQQLRRSANSIVANIAESHGRYTFKDKIRVLYQARGEILETRSHLKIGEALHYLPENKAKELDSRYEGLLKGVNSFIRYLANRNSAQYSQSTS